MFDSGSNWITFCVFYNFFCFVNLISIIYVFIYLKQYVIVSHILFCFISI